MFLHVTEIILMPASFFKFCNTSCHYEWRTPRIDDCIEADTCSEKWELRQWPHDAKAPAKTKTLFYQCGGKKGEELCHNDGD
jgi:hypothetical protein